MSRGLFEPRFEDLPDRIPIFPLTGVLLLPRGRLPLNIFEPRYLAMIRDALGATHRLIGMVQPEETGGTMGGVIPGDPPVHRIGCAGRIVSFGETGDGRYIVELRGVSRFAIRAESQSDRAYRAVAADWTPYRGDLDEQPSLVDRQKLMTVMKDYFAHADINADWHALETLMDDRLVITIAMLAPFAPPEKQALLEAADTAQRAELLIGLMEMAMRADPGLDRTQRH
jgi:uncharacterized protein